jgi:hypothetical protein
VLGSGTDVDFGLPTMATLMQEIAGFVRGEGESVDKALRKPITELDREVFRLSMKYASLEDRESPEAQEVARQLDELIARQEAAGG